MSNLYQSDFYAWTITQAKLLAQGQFNQLDIPNLIEEITSLGKQQEQELENRLGILLGHLLKWYYQPELRSKSWRATIRVQRNEIQRHLQKNPSLKSYLREAIAIGYPKGLGLIDQETPLDPEQLPQVCPFSDEQIFTEPLELLS
ncbi:MAG: DUF29 domain-containing protein [Gloeomargarita sp. HHBFW_bins_162]